MNDRYEIKPYDHLRITKTRSGWRVEHFGEDENGNKGLMRPDDFESATFDGLVKNIKTHFAVD